MVISNGLQDFETMPVKKSLRQIQFHRDNARIYGVLTGRELRKIAFGSEKLTNTWRKVRIFVISQFALFDLVDNF